MVKEPARKKNTLKDIVCPKIWKGECAQSHGYCCWVTKIKAATIQDWFWVNLPRHRGGGRGGMVVPVLLVSAEWQVINYHVTTWLWLKHS